MELDKRIKEGKKPLTAFDEMESKFIGTDCFFSDKPSDFADLSKCQVGKLMSLDAVSGMFGASKNNSYAVFYFCLPCEWVEEKKEPKYRPFSLEEFLKIFDIGDQIGFRSKDNGEVKYAMFVGYTDDFFADNTDRSDGENDVMIGIYRFSLSYLFENYDLYFEDEWQPFGVIDE